MHRRSDNDLAEGLMLGNVSHVSDENHLLKSPPSHRLEHNTFRLSVFFEFFGYFLLAAFLGPLSYLFFRYMKHGRVLARNLQVFGGKKEFFRTFVWLMKLFCYITTFTYKPDPNTYEYDSISQFWILIYTDVSLCVLYAAYYSSYTKSEVHRFKTEVYDPGNNIFDRLMHIIRESKNRYLDKNALYSTFPEISPETFFFVYPKSTENLIPSDLDAKPLQSTAPQFKLVGMQNALIVPGENVVAYIVEKAGYHHLEFKVVLCKFISRLIIFIRVILPVVQNVLNILGKTHPMEHVGRFIIYGLQQIFYSILIYRFVNVFDVLFLGLFLYWKKYNMLNKLGEMISVQPQNDRASRKELRVSGSVPENALNWLNVRRILASLNEQVFIVVDVNMSFVLLYTFIFITLFFLQVLGLLKGLLEPAQNFLQKNPALLLVLALTILIVIIVLIIDVVIGLFINGLFTTERGLWIIQRQIAGHIETKYEMFMDEKYDEGVDKKDAHIKKVYEIKEILGSNFQRDFYVYLRRLRNSITLVLDAIATDEENNPHTILGVPIKPTTIVLISTLSSAIGITTINEFVQALSKNAIK